MILGIVFLPLRSWALVPGLLLCGVGYVFSGLVVPDPNIVMFVLGLHPAEVWRYTVDYFPLLPWFGVVLVGVGMGSLLYDGHERRFHLPHVRGPLVRAMSYVGQQSLLVYLLHQPVLAGTVYVVAYALHL